MSWSKSVGPGSGSGLVEEIDAIDITQGGNSTPETEEQIALAKKLAKQAVESGAVGPFDDGTEFSVTISGHTNPKHNPHTEGASSADSFYVRVDQTSAPELPEEPVEDEDAETGADHVPQPGSGAGDGSGDE